MTVRTMSTKTMMMKHYATEMNTTTADEGADFSRLVATELYDHTKDPAENVNVAGWKTKAETVATLSAMLRTRVRP